MVKVIKKDGKTYVELPDELSDKNIKTVKLSGMFIVTTEDVLKEIIERQVKYLVGKKIGEKLVQRGTGAAGTKQPPQKEHAREWWIFPNEDVAKKFSKENEIAFKRGELLGIKGFDGRVYVVSAGAYSRVLPKIIEALEDGPKTVAELAGITGEQENLVKAVLEIAREEGTVYETKNGRYHHVG